MTIAFNVAARRLNGSSRERRAQLIRLFPFKGAQK